MHGDISPHLHTEECNAIVSQLIQCRLDHPYGKFLGYCNDIDMAMTKCFRRERENKRTLNRLKAEERMRITIEKQAAARAERKKLANNETSDGAS